VAKRKHKNARKIYPVSLHQLARELELNPLQRVKVGKFIEQILKKGGVT
jgi:hypothetical protein